MQSSELRPLFYRTLTHPNVAWVPTFCAALAPTSALHRTILCAMRFTTLSVSHASTHIGSALASFLHRLPRGAEGV